MLQITIHILKTTIRLNFANDFHYEFYRKILREAYGQCQFCCSKCYEDYGECPNPDCDPMDI